MKSFSRETLIKPMVELSDLDRSVPTYIYGSARMGYDVRTAMDAGPPWAFRGFIDSRQSGQVDGYPLYHVDEFSSVYAPGDQIVIASQWVDEIAATLSSMGIPEAFDANPWEQRHAEELRGRRLADVPFAGEVLHWLHKIFSQTGASLNLQNEQFALELLKTERFADPLRLRPRIAKYFSSAYEDSVIEEIFKRIGTTNKQFVEFGVGADCGENNTLYLLIQGWRGLWMDISSLISTAARGPLRSLVSSGQLRAVHARVTAENVNELFVHNGVREEIDLLSIDIDGNDYWVWKAIECTRPRVVVIEYNAVLGPHAAVTIPNSPDWVSRGSYYFGCSLHALEKLGREKGYSLVGCDISGVNAYFVRSDLTAGLLLEPFTAENHFEPMRYFLCRIAGHSLGFGEFVDV